MSCCAPAGDELCFDEVGTSNEKLMLFSWTQRDGRRQSDLLVPDIHCGGWLQRIELATPITAGPVP